MKQEKVPTFPSALASARTREEGMRRRLIEVAIAQIERHGIANLTVRAVAAEAGANVASVNYYFRSKDALVEQALAESIDHMLEDSGALLARLLEDPHGGLVALLGYYLEGSLRFPGLVKAHLHGAFNDGDYSGRFPSLFVPVIEKVRDTLQQVVPGLDAVAAARRTTAALSGAFFPAFFSGLFRTLDPLRDAATRADYLNDLAHAALVPLAEGRSRARRKRASRG